MVTESQDDRPEATEKATTRRRNQDDAPASGSNRINYNLRTGEGISVDVSNIQDVDALVASGVWDAPQGKKEDVENTPILLMDAMRMSGKWGPWYIGYCAYLDEIEKKVPNPQFFTIPFNGTVLPRKIATLLGEDLATGNLIPGSIKRFPAKGKLVQIEGDENVYWDFRRPEWRPEDDEVEKPKLAAR